VGAAVSCNSARGASVRVEHVQLTVRMAAEDTGEDTADSEGSVGAAVSCNSARGASVRVEHVQLTVRMAAENTGEDQAD
jgi:hypothetical protein